MRCCFLLHRGVMAKWVCLFCYGIAGFFHGLLGVVVDLGFTTLLTSQVISVAFYSEGENSDKLCSEALISAWGSLTCCKSTTWETLLYFPSERSHTQDFFTVWKNPSTPAGIEPATSDPDASMITTGPPGSTQELVNACLHRTDLCSIAQWP